SRRTGARAGRGDRENRRSSGADTRRSRSASGAPERGVPVRRADGRGEDRTPFQATVYRGGPPSDELEVPGERCSYLAVDDRERVQAITIVAGAYSMPCGRARVNNLILERPRRSGCW